MGQRVRASENIEETTDALVTGGMKRTGDGRISVAVTLDSSREYVALQADIIVPEGTDIEVKALEGAVNHSLETMKLDDNHIRLALYNLGNKAFAAGNDPVFEIITDADAEGLTIFNILAADSEANEYVLASGTGVSTGVEGPAGDAVMIEKISGGVKVSNASGRRVEVYTLDGQLVKTLVASDTIEIINLSSGLYVVKAGDKTLKVVL